MASMRGFKDVEFTFGQIFFKGGCAKSSMPMTTKAVPDPRDPSKRKTINFIKMATSEPWLIHAVTGCKRYSATSFGRTTLLEDLRKEVQRYCDGEVSHAAVAAEGEDPMLEVQADDAAVPYMRETHDGKRARYVKRFRQALVLFCMPELCPELCPVRTIRLWIVDRQQIWLHMDDVEWAVKYLFVQNQLKGVPFVHDDSTGPMRLPSAFSP